MESAMRIPGGGLSRRDLIGAMALSMASGTLGNSPATAKPGQVENARRAGSLVIAASQSENFLSATSGGWRIWSLSDGYIEMPANLLRDRQNHPLPQAASTGPLRLSVNCFALVGPRGDGVLIDCGGGGWASTVGNLEQTMAEARIDPASITLLALTHTHQDHVQGLLTPDGRMLLPNLRAIVIPEAAVKSFFKLTHLARFRSLLKPIRNDDQVAVRLRAVALPGHAPGHTGYALDTGEDRFLFFGDVVHVPAL